MNLSQIKSDALTARKRVDRVAGDAEAWANGVALSEGQERIDWRQVEVMCREVAVVFNSTIALVDRLERLEKAAQNFIDKVDRGEARSVRSYAEFKEALGGEREPTAEERLRMKDERIAELEAKLAARQALGEDQ